MKIQVHTGRAFDLLNPDPKDIHWMDLAVMLARTNRFHGGTTWCEWSVAQHSVLAVMYGTDVNKASDEDRLSLLLHDAAEAYCGDLMSPLRRAMKTMYTDRIDPYTEIYTGVQDAVRRWAGLPEGAFETTLVKHVDLRMLATERELFMARPWIPDWIDLPPPYVTESDLQPPTLLTAQKQRKINGRAMLWCPWQPYVAAMHFARCLRELAPHLSYNPAAPTPFPWSEAPSWARVAAEAQGPVQ